MMLDEGFQYYTSRLIEKTTGIKFRATILIIAEI